MGGESPVNAGLPAWAAAGFACLGPASAAAAWSALLVAAEAVLVRVLRRSTLRPAGRLGLSVLALLTVGLVALWALVAHVASRAPPGGRFCFTPETWTGSALATCTARWPATLMTVPLGGALALLCAGVGLSQALHPGQARRAALWATAALGLALAALRGQGFIEPTLFQPGGIAPAATALKALMLDPRALGGAALLGATLLICGWPRKQAALPR